MDAPSTRCTMQRMILTVVSDSFYPPFSTVESEKQKLPLTKTLPFEEEEGGARLGLESRVVHFQ